MQIQISKKRKANCKKIYTDTEIKTPFQINQPSKIQECNYQGQMYLPGDIVKASPGWIRCMSAVSFEISDPQSGPMWAIN